MTRKLPLSDLATSDLLHRCAIIRDQLSQAGLFPSLTGQASTPGIVTATTTWRIATTPFPLKKDQLDFFHQLGPQLLSFYRALNRLYIDSVRGLQPAWVAGYLDQGKPDGLVTYSRMKRFRDQLPAVIRPDIIPTQDGMVITELDSVPGGIGLTGALTEIYSQWSPGDRGGPRGDGTGICGHVEKPARPAYRMRRDSDVGGSQRLSA